MEIEIEISKETLTKLYKVFILLFFFGFSLWIFYLNYQTVQNYPIVFGDEGYHMRIAKEMFNRKEFLHYLDYYKPNPPAYGYLSIFHFLEAFGFLISEWFARLLLPLTVFLIAFSMFVIFWKLFDEKVALISAILFQTFQSTVIYSVTFYVDSLFVLFVFLGFGFLLLFSKERKIEYILLSSAFFSLQYITKTGIVILTYPCLLIFLFWYFISRKIGGKEILSLLFPIIFVITITTFQQLVLYNKICLPHQSVVSRLLNDVIFKNFNGSCEKVLIDYKDTLKFEGRTEQVGSEVDVFSFGLENYISFAYGNPAIFFILTFTVSMSYLYFYKRFELLILLFPIFQATIVWLLIFYPLTGDLGIFYRAEDTARSLYFFNPFLSLYIAFFIIFLQDFFKNLFKRNEKWGKYMFFILFFVLLIYIVSISWSNYSSKLEVMKKVKTFSPYFFEACEWVKNNLDKNATLMSLWGHRVVYACERNVGGTADLRLSNNATFVNELAKRLGVDYFFVEKFSIDPLNRRLAEMYDLSWVKMLYENKNYFEVIYENGNPFNQCKEMLTRGYVCDGVIIFKVR